MSSAAEISMLVREVADLTAPSQNWKDRVSAAARALGLPFGRVKSLYYGEARRVDAEEMDSARAAARELREQARIDRENSHLAWLESEIGRLRASGQEFRGAHADGLEHFLRMARGADSALALQQAGEDADVPAAHASEVGRLT